MAFFSKNGRHFFKRSYRHDSFYVFPPLDTLSFHVFPPVLENLSFSHFLRFSPCNGDFANLTENFPVSRQDW
eukprot:UN18746